MQRCASKSFFTILILALTAVVNVGAIPRPIVQVRDNLVRLPFAKHMNSTGTASLIQRDQARARHLRARANAKLNGLALTKDDDISVTVHDGMVGYAADVSIGSPPTTYSLLIDTGSANTWVGADQEYMPTSSSTNTTDTVSAEYDFGYFAGTEVIDIVDLGSGLTISKQSIGVASKSEGFGKFDGILGIGPVGLTVGTLYPHDTATIPTVTDNLFSESVIEKNIVAMSFQPPFDVGELIFGGTDPFRFIEPMITATRPAQTLPASRFWGINQSIRYGLSTNILSGAAGIVDSGASLVLIATDALERYRLATGAVFDEETGLLRITQAQFANLESLFFEIDGVNFEFTANAQIFPRALNEVIGGQRDVIYLIVGDLGMNSGEGFDFMNGKPWLERFYTVFNTTSGRVSIANTAFTKAEVN